MMQMFFEKRSIFCLLSIQNWGKRNNEELKETETDGRCRAGQRVWIICCARRYWRPLTARPSEQEGFWVWESILTDEGQKQFTASLQKLQHMNDRILMDTDWTAIDFEARGLESPPPEQITPEFLESCCGGSEQMPSFLRSEVRAYMHEHGLLGPGAGVSHTRI